MPHYSTYVHLWRLQQKMVVITHQAVRMDDAVKHLLCLWDFIQECLIVDFVVENDLSAAATVHYMIK